MKTKLADSQVAIVGIHQSSYEGTKKDVALVDLIFDVTDMALRDAGLGIDDIDNVVLAAHDQIDGRPISTMLTGTAAGAYLKDEIRVANDGAFAVALAWMKLLSGKYKRTLVVSWSKSSEGNPELISNYGFDPFFYRPFAMNSVTACAVQAMSYEVKWGVGEDGAAKVVVKNRSNGAMNPLSHVRSPVTEKDVLSSEMLSWPLRKLHVPPYSDGACAMVLTTKEYVGSKRHPVAWIKGAGWAVDSYYLAERDLWSLPSLSMAARKAYQIAGVKNPVEDIDVAEISDISAFHELMTYEALGLCEQGEGGKFLEMGRPLRSGSLPVNPSGGLTSANPCAAAGLVRVAEAALQVTGKAGARQVDGARTALAHGTSGIAGQNNCVVILGQ